MCLIFQSLKWRCMTMLVFCQWVITEIEWIIHSISVITHCQNTSIVIQLHYSCIFTESLIGSVECCSQALIDSYAIWMCNILQGLPQHYFGWTWTYNNWLELWRSLCQCEQWDLNFILNRLNQISPDSISQPLTVVNLTLKLDPVIGWENLIVISG